MNVTNHKNKKLSVFAERLHEIRLAKKWTQLEFAEKIGITRVAYGNYEKDERHPDCDIVTSICRVANVSADYLLGLSSTPTVNYSNISDTTGLNENSIQYLDAVNRNDAPLICMINYLLEEQPHHSEIDFENMDSPYVPDEDAGQCNLNDEEWAEYLSKHPYLLDAPTYEEQKRMDEYYEKEFSKSNLLSHLKEYIDWGSKALTSSNSETYEANIYPNVEQKLSNSEPLLVGFHGGSITFPSKEADEVIEFMMLQKVIDALRIFKKNYRNQ